jgi:hypothetical protein
MSSFGLVEENIELSHIHLAVLTTGRSGGGGCQKFRKIADAIYGWYLFVKGS